MALRGRLWADPLRCARRPRLVDAALSTRGLLAWGYAMVSEVDRRAMLEALTQQLGDVPPMPSVNVWELARIDAAIGQYLERGEAVPASLWQARSPLAVASTALGMESGAPLMACPFFQSMAAACVNALRSDVEGGDGGAVLEAVAACLSHGLVAPGWLAAAFVVRHERVTVGDAKSWADAEVFGSAVPAGLNVNGVRARKQLGPRAYDVALQLLARDPSRPIDKGFFEVVGDQIGRGSTAAENLIRDHVASGSYTWPPLAELKRFLVDANGDLGQAWAAWADAKSLAVWREAGGTDEEWADTYGREPRAAGAPNNCDDFPGLQA